MKEAFAGQYSLKAKASSDLEINKMEQISANLLIVLATVGISLYAFNNYSFLENWLMHPYAVERRKEYHRFITSGFVHADYMHLFFNMYTLYSFGEFMEQVFIQRFDDPKIGSVAYVLFYVIAIVVSDLPTFVKHRKDSGYRSLGASGAVSAVIFGTILFIPTAQLAIFFIPMPAFIFAILYLAYTYYEMRRGNGYINHSAHWWGAIFGIIMMVLLYPEVLPSFISQILNWRPFN
ncbi:MULTISPECIES: rhomboid family intramembrane serine protease [Emticicia]|uniref:rhomboid family intramembrane serine protease n=1 Tax=Emticicia TaxID=312278 RepID=UPI000A68B714|nr:MULTISPECIES: rhomboid family intramembrane serine protease [Emticicia]